LCALDLTRPRRFVELRHRAEDLPDQLRGRRIIAALEEHYPEPPLYPVDTVTRQRALALEDDLDETLGPALRAAIVTPLFRHDPDIALRVLTTGMGDRAYRTLRPLLGMAARIANDECGGAGIKRA
jgi:glutathione S-transferase